MEYSKIFTARRLSVGLTTISAGAHVVMVLGNAAMTTRAMTSSSGVQEVDTTRVCVSFT